MRGALCFFLYTRKMMVETGFFGERSASLREISPSRIAPAGADAPGHLDAGGAGRR